jgi:hypothetical protein
LLQKYCAAFPNVSHRRSKMALSPYLIFHFFGLGLLSRTVTSRLRQKFQQPVETLQGGARFVETPDAPRALGRSFG